MGKIKEHLRSRHMVEKQNTALQQLYNNVREELNSSKLTVSNNQYEMDELRNKLTNIEAVNKRLRESVANLEVKLTNALMVNVTCEKCIELDQLRSKLDSALEESERNSEQLKFNEKQLKESDFIIDQLKKQVKLLISS